MSKKIIKASQKVARDTMEEKKRFHLYKSGKLWLVAGLATLSFATGELAAQAQTQSVHADVTTSKAATSSAASSATALKSSVAASSSATSAPASSAVTSSAASSATPSSATSSTAASDASSAASSSSSQASSSSSSEATSSASSKADTDQKSSAVNSSSATTAKSSAATSSSASTAKSSAANASSSATTAKSSAASTSSAAANSSSATKKTTSSAASSAASSKELNTKFHLDDVATIKQDGDELILDVAANKKLTDEQYQAIVDYATRNHLTVKGLSKQEQATHKTTASGEDLSGKFFATGSTKKGAAHDGDTITLDGDTITISLDSTKYHYLTKAETEALLDYIQSNNLKLVDNTVKSITTITFTDGTTGHSKTDGGHTKDDMLGYETRTSDPLVFLLGDTDVTGWNSIVIETSNGTDSTQSGNQRGQNTLFATGAYASHTYTAVVNGKVGAITIMSDAIVSIGEYSDTDSWFNIKNSDGSYANEKFVDAKDGNITAGKGPDGQYSKVILTDDQVQQLLRGMAYVANHPGTSITYNYSATEFNSENNGPDSEGRRGLDDFPVGSQKDFTGDIIVNVVDQDGNVIYSETDKANGGIANPKDATDAGLKDDSDDVKAKGSVDINDVLNNLFAGKNADGTEGTIKYIAGDGNEIWTDGTTTVEVSFTEAANGGVTVTYHVVDNT